MTAGRKLWLGFGTLTALLVLSSVAIIIRVRSIEGQVAQMASARNLSDEARRLEIHALGHALAVRLYLIEGDPKVRRHALAEAADVDRHFAEYRRLSTTDRQRQMAALFAPLWHESSALGQALLASQDRRLKPEDSRKFHDLRAGMERLLDDEMQAEAIATYNARRDAALQDVQSIVGFVLILLLVGAVIAVVTSATVGTTVVHAERLVQANRELLRVTLASIGDAVIATDTQGRATYLNPAAESLTGWEHGQAAGLPLDQMFRVMSQETGRPVETPGLQALSQGVPVSLADHTVLFAKDGTQRAIDGSVAPIRSVDGDLVGCVLVFRDITERTAMEDELVQRRRSLEDQVRERTAELLEAHDRLKLADRMAAVGTLAAGLAHDMNNVTLPLGMRLGAILAAPALEADLKNELTAITALLNHLRQMSRNLSLFARDPTREGSGGRTELAPWVKQVKGFMEASVAGEASPSDRIRLKCDVPDGLPAVGVAPHRLTQAVLNLVHNARDAIHATRPAPASGAPETARSDTADPGIITIQARTSPSGDAVILKVSDAGCGMDEETRRRCIEPFFTTKDRPNVAGEDGSGMGMSLAYAIAQRVGGHMDIESQPGQGTTVSLTLPIAVADPAIEIDPKFN